MSKRGASRSVRFAEARFFNAAKNRAFNSDVANMIIMAQTAVEEPDFGLNGRPMDLCRDMHTISALAEWAEGEVLMEEFHEYQEAKQVGHEVEIDLPRVEGFSKAYELARLDLYYTVRPSSRIKKLNRPSRVKPLHKEVTLGMWVSSQPWR